MKNLVGGVENVYETERERERSRFEEQGRKGVVQRPRELEPYLFIPIVTVQDFISVSERFPPSCQFIYTYA